MASQPTGGGGTMVDVHPGSDPGAISDARHEVAEKAHELRDAADTRFREQVDQRSTQFGEQVQALGEALATGASQLRGQGKESPAQFAQQAAERVEQLGSYLTSSDSNRLLTDIERFARQRPWLTAGIGALAGFAASRFVKASSERRYEAARAASRTAYHTSRDPALGGGMR